MVTTIVHGASIRNHSSCVRKFSTAEIVIKNISSKWTAGPTARMSTYSMPFNENLLVCQNKLYNTDQPSELGGERLLQDTGCSWMIQPRLKISQHHSLSTRLHRERSKICPRRTWYRPCRLLRRSRFLPCRIGVNGKVGSPRR